MPDISSYTFSHGELLEVLIREANLHEGEWMLLVNFGFSAANFGPDNNNMNPGAVAVVSHIGIVRAKEGAPHNLVRDAAKINPASAT